MALLSLQDVSLTFGGPLLLDSVTLQIEEGQRVCLLGRNGAGKSSLLSTLSGEIPPDSGEVIRRQGLRVAMLPQKVEQNLPGTVYDVAASGLGQVGERLTEYHSISTKLAHAAGDDATRLTARLSAAQEAIDAAGGWDLNQRVEMVIARLKLDPEATYESLSGGMKRRCLLARALAGDPEVLILDEPTNHLDIDSITWLEDFLLRRVKTLVFVTHDRAFLRRVATRIVELDRGHIYDWACDYDTFLARKEEVLHAEQKEWERFDKKLAEEEVWIRKGIKARRTRNMGRVRELRAMRDERGKRRERQGEATIMVQEAERSGRLVAVAENLTFAYEGAPVIRNFSATVLRGDCVGLIGPNGAGKTTLLKLLLGQLTPQSGSLKLGTRLEIAYFDQLRGTLDPNRSVRENVADGNDWVFINDNKRHVMGYLSDFLFTAEQANTKAGLLSGGERNRLLLAKLFTRPSNVLVLDEPTNDLDIETLDLLEERLAEYSGTVLVVSHDREFINNVATSTLAFEGGGQVIEYAGGYDDWLSQRQPRTEEALRKAAPAADSDKRRKSGGSVDANGRKKLSYKEKLAIKAEREELAALPARLEALEAEQAELHETLSDPELYAEGPEKSAALTARLEALDTELETGLERWAYLEEKLADAPEID